MHFILTTNQKVAEQIRRQCAFDLKHGNRSYKLDKIYHDDGFSTVKIDAVKDLIDPCDIFWLGYFSAITGK